MLKRTIQSSAVALAFLLSALNPAAAAPEGTLRVALSSFGQETWTPFTPSAVSKVVNSYLMEYLIDIDPETSELRPGLATEWSSSDAKVWRLKLREGVKWSDGSDFTATDAKFSFDIHSKQKSNNSTATVLAPILESVEIVGPHEIEVRLNTPTPMLPLYLSRLNTLWIVPAKYEKELLDGSFDDNPVGTGPFRRVEWIPGTSVTYEAVADHYRVVPDFKTLELRQVPEAATQVAMLRAGEVDVISIGPEDMAAVEAEGFRVVQLNNNPSFISLQFGGLWLPTRETYDPANPWLKKELRMAVNHAVDRQELGETLYYGLGVPAAIEILMPNTVGWNPEWRPYEYDPDRARQLIADAGGWPEGKVVDVFAYDKAGLPMLSETMEAIAAYLEAVGIPTRIVPIDQTMVISATRAKDKMLVGGLWPQTGSFTPDQDQRTRAYWTGASGFFEDPALDALLQKSFAAVSREDREATAQAAYQYIYDNHASVPLVNYKYVMALSPNVAAFTEMVGDEVSFMEYVKINH